MLAFRWGSIGVALLIAITHGALITSTANGYDDESIGNIRRSKRSYKRGQTQSQYLNFGQPELDGKAEAEATEGGSRSTVSGTHGMGQAQSQFSSGDCSGCAPGSAVYEYSSGSPDPLVLGGSVIPRSDGKASSIIGLHDSTPKGSFGSAPSFTIDSSGQGGRPGAGGTFAQGGGAQSVLPGIRKSEGPPGMRAPAIQSGGGAEQTSRPSSGRLYIPSNADTGAIGRNGIDGSYAPGSVSPPRTSGAGQIGRPRPDGSYAPASHEGNTGVPVAGREYGPGNSYGSGIGGMPQFGRTGGNIDTEQIGRPTGGDYTSGIAYAPGSYAPGTGAGHMNIGGVGGSYAPGTAYSGVSVPIGKPGTDDSTYSTGTGARQVGTSASSGDYAPGSPYSPPSGGPGQIGKPGTGIYGPAADTSSSYLPGSRGVIPMVAPGTSYGPSATTGDIAQHGHPGVRKPGIGGITQGQKQPQSPQLITTPGALPGQVQVQQTGTNIGPQTSLYPYGSGKPIFTGTPGTSYIPQQSTVSQQQPTYGSDGVPSKLSPPTSTYEQQIPGTQVTQPGSFYRPSQQHIPQQATIGYPQQFVYTPGYEIPPDAASISGLSARPGSSQEGINGPSQQSQGYLEPSSAYGKPSTALTSRFENDYPLTAGFGQPGTDSSQADRTPSHRVLQPGFSYNPKVSTPQSNGRVQPGGIQTGAGLNQSKSPDQYGRTQPSEGLGFIQPATGSKASNYQPPSSVPHPGQSGYIPGMQPKPVYGGPGDNSQTAPTRGQESSFLPQSPRITNGQPGLVTGQQPGVADLHRRGDQQQRTGSFAPQSNKYGTDIQQVPGYTSGYGPQDFTVHPKNNQQVPFAQPDESGMSPTRGFPHPGTRTQTGIEQHIGNQPGQSQQGTIQSRPEFSQYPAGGYIPQTSAGVHQGASTQYGYDSTYRGQPSAGYGQPSGGSQYAQPGITEYGQGPQQVLQQGGTYIPGSVPSSGLQQGTAGSGSVAANDGGAEDAFSQAESSIGNGQAAASAQGKKNGGTAKTQVQGTYSSSGSFSASAMTSDNDRSASSQVTGGVEGAMSQSQGQGGAAQSQAQVQVNEKTGGTKASSQSGGIIHQSQSEVQANDKGGLADAQSSGPGQTSSQAQIGFRPGKDGEIVRSAGGGQASAQSGAHYGNSQSQIQGTSKYAVSYHGAAQSASGTKEQVATYREQNRNLFNTISQFGGTDAVTDRVDTIYNPSLTSESDIPDLQLKSSRTNKEVIDTNKLDDDSISPDEDEDEEPYDEYEDEEDYYNENPIKMETKANGDKKLESSSIYRTHTQTSPTQTQQAAIADNNNKYNVIQNQNGRVKIYPVRTTTETVPNGFRGTVNVEKKFHTKSLETHKAENKSNITSADKSENNPPTPDSYVTVTKSITGSMDNSKSPPEDNKKFQSTYYTKSSTCGYFTFSCNIVYGANGRSKICRPKAPTNGKC